MGRRGTLSAIGVAGVLAASGLAVTLPASAAATGCTVTYRVQSQWTGGFVTDIVLTNLGPAVSSWTLTFAFPDAGQKVANGWSANWSQSGGAVSAASYSWNGSLATNASVSMGFVGAATGANPVPASFALDGTPCTGTLNSPSPSPSLSPSATPSPSVSPSTSPSPSTSTPAGAAPALHVDGNRILTADGTPYRLLGVNRSSGEFACVQGKGMWDGADPTPAQVDAMKTWNIHAVRIPLNEDCWLGTFGTPSGPQYQKYVKDYVDLLVSNGINPILDLHWTHGSYAGSIAPCPAVTATCQKPMPNAEYTPQFWTQVATTFKGNDAVVFDLFNEPFPDAADNWASATNEWTCLRDGGTCTGITYEVAGMQDLVDAVRATGATNMLLVAGLGWTNTLTQWLEYAPKDPLDNIVASWHTYNFNTCKTVSCWDSQIGAVAAKVPVQAGEIGQDTCAHDYIDQVMAWADKNGVGYLGWTWNPWGIRNSNGNVLIADWDGTPTSSFGEGFKAHLATVKP